MAEDKQRLFRNMAKYNQKDPPKDSEKFKNAEDNFEKYFKENLKKKIK